MKWPVNHWSRCALRALMLTALLLRKSGCRWAQNRSKAANSSILKYRTPEPENDFLHGASRASALPLAFFWGDSQGISADYTRVCVCGVSCGWQSRHCVKTQNILGWGGRKGARDRVSSTETRKGADGSFAKTDL